MKRWKVAIVGAGYMADEHARAFASLEAFELVGLTGRSQDRAAALAAKFSIPVYGSIDALYQATQADLVVVAVNELSANQVFKACFAHPWVCFVEKPIGLDLADALDIEAAAKAANSQVFVGLNRRSYAATRAVLADLEADASPRLVSVLDQQDIESARAGGQPEAVLENYMFANSIHLVDYFGTFCRGDLVDLSVSRPWTPTNPGHVVATMTYSSGDTGVYQAVWDGPGPWSVSVTNASARYELRPLEALGVQRRGERRLVPVELSEIDTTFKPGLRFQAEQSLALLRGEAAHLPSLADAIASTRLCAGIYGMGAAAGAQQ